MPDPLDRPAARSRAQWRRRPVGQLHPLAEVLRRQAAFLAEVAAGVVRTPAAAARTARTLVVSVVNRPSEYSRQSAFRM
jgi:hypothetical protein